MPAPEQTASGNRWAVLAVLCAGLFLGGMDLTVLQVAVPSILADLRPGRAALLWTVDAYPLTVAALLVTCGTLADRYGRRRLLLAGLGLFAAASALAAYAPSPGALIAARVLLGAAMAMIMSCTVALIRALFPDARERTLALGVWTAAHSAGATLGPLLGGLLVQHWHWGAVFLVNVPVTAVALAAGARLVPESRSPLPRRWDAAGALLSASGLAAVVYALKHPGGVAGGDPAPIAAGLAGALLLCAFVRRQRRAAQPLLDLKLLAERRIATALGCILTGFGSHIALLFFLTLWLQRSAGRSPLEAGLALMPLAAASAAGAVAAPWCARRFGARRALPAAMLLLGCALAPVGPAAAAGGYPALVACLLVSGTAAGAVMTLGADAVMGAAGPERAGEAAALQETSFELGAGLCVAALGTAAHTLTAFGVLAASVLLPTAAATAYLTRARLTRARR